MNSINYSYLSPPSKAKKIRYPSTSRLPRELRLLEYQRRAQTPTLRPAAIRALLVIAYLQNKGNPPQEKTSDGLLLRTAAEADLLRALHDLRGNLKSEDVR